MTYKIGIIGLGGIAQKAYLPIIGIDSRVEIVGIMSRTQEIVKHTGERYRIQGQYTDLDELLNNKLDAVFVHTPTETHEHIVTACLQRGVHVYVDKPLSYDIESSMRMVNAAKVNQCLLAVGFNRRFAPIYQEAKRFMNKVGGFDLCIAEKHRTTQQKLTAKETLYDDLIHMIDLVLWMGAKPYEILSYLQEQDETGRLLHATGQLCFGRSTALFSMNRRTGADAEKLVMHGGGRSIAVENMETAIYHDREQGESSFNYGSWDSIGVRRGFEGVISHFLDSLGHTEGCSITAESCLESHLLIEKLLKMTKKS